MLTSEDCTLIYSGYPLYKGLVYYSVHLLRIWTARLAQVNFPPKELIPQKITFLWIASFLLLSVRTFFFFSAMIFQLRWLITNLKRVCSWLAGKIWNKKVFYILSCIGVSRPMSGKQSQDIGCIPSCLFFLSFVQRSEKKKSRKKACSMDVMWIQTKTQRFLRLKFIAIDSNLKIS